MITNQETGTRIDEVASGIYRICTPLDVIPGGFTINSYLLVDEEPVLFHTGYRKLFPITLEAITKGAAGASRHSDHLLCCRCASPKRFISPFPISTARGWSSVWIRAKGRKTGTPCSHRSCGRSSVPGGAWRNPGTGFFQATSRAGTLPEMPWNWPVRKPVFAFLFASQLPLTA